VLDVRKTASASTEAKGDKQDANETIVAWIGEVGPSEMARRAIQNAGDGAQNSAVH
jgi:hypothetical protein